jgi:hypothetical protein
MIYLLSLKPRKQADGKQGLGDPRLYGENPAQYLEDNELSE